MPSKYRIYKSRKTIQADPVYQDIQFSEVQADLQTQVERSISEVPLEHRFWQPFSDSECDNEYGGRVIIQHSYKFGFDGMLENRCNRITVHYLFNEQDEHLVFANLSFPTIEREKVDKILENILRVYDRFFNDGK